MFIILKSNTYFDASTDIYFVHSQYILFKVGIRKHYREIYIYSFILLFMCDLLHNKFGLTHHLIQILPIIK